MRIGMLGVAVGAAGLMLVAPSWGIPWLALPFWLVAGLGMGLGYSSLSFLLLATSDHVGRDSAAAQLTDQLAQAVFVGLGGALLALLAGPAVALPVLLVVLVALAVVGAVTAPRTAG
jgi:hypothetical protein